MLPNIKTEFVTLASSLELPLKDYSEEYESSSTFHYLKPINIHDSYTLQLFSFTERISIKQVSNPKSNSLVDSSKLLGTIKQLRIFEEVIPIQCFSPLRFLFQSSINILVEGFIKYKETKSISLISISCNQQNNVTNIIGYGSRSMCVFKEMLFLLTNDGLGIGVISLAEDKIQNYLPQLSLSLSSEINNFFAIRCHDKFEFLCFKQQQVFIMRWSLNGEEIKESRNSCFLFNVDEIIHEVTMSNCDFLVGIATSSRVLIFSCQDGQIHLLNEVYASKPTNLLWIGYSLTYTVASQTQVVIKYILPSSSLLSLCGHDIPSSIKAILRLYNLNISNDFSSGTLVILPIISSDKQLIRFKTLAIFPNRIIYFVETQRGSFFRVKPVNISECLVLGLLFAVTERKEEFQVVAKAVVSNHQNKCFSQQRVSRDSNINIKVLIALIACQMPLLAMYACNMNPVTKSSTSWEHLIEVNEHGFSPCRWIDSSVIFEIIRIYCKQYNQVLPLDLLNIFSRNFKDIQDFSAVYHSVHPAMLQLLVAFDVTRKDQRETSENIRDEIDSIERSLRLNSHHSERCDVKQFFNYSKPHVNILSYSEESFQSLEDIKIVEGLLKTLGVKQNIVSLGVEDDLGLRGVLELSETSETIEKYNTKATQAIPSDETSASIQTTKVVNKVDVLRPTTWVDLSMSNDKCVGYWRFSDLKLATKTVSFPSNLEKESPTTCRVLAEVLDLSKFSALGRLLLIDTHVNIDNASLELQCSTSDCDPGESHDRVKALNDVVFLSQKQSSVCLMLNIGVGGPNDLVFNKDESRQSMTIEFSVFGTIMSSCEHPVILFQRLLKNGREVISLFITENNTLQFKIGDYARSFTRCNEELERQEEFVLFDSTMQWRSISIVLSCINNDELTATLYVNGQFIDSMTINFPSSLFEIASSSPSYFIFSRNFPFSWRFTELRCFLGTRSQIDIEEQRLSYLSLASKRKRQQQRIKGTKELFSLPWIESNNYQLYAQTFSDTVEEICIDASLLDVIEEKEITKDNDKTKSLALPLQGPASSKLRPKIPLRPFNA